MRDKDQLEEEARQDAEIDTIRQGVKGHQPRTGPVQTDELTNRQMLHKWLGGQSAELVDELGEEAVLNLLRIVERRRGHQRKDQLIYHDLEITPAMDEHMAWFNEGYKYAEAKLGHQAAQAKVTCGSLDCPERTGGECRWSEPDSGVEELLAIPLADYTVAANQAYYAAGTSEDEEASEKFHKARHDFLSAVQTLITQAYDRGKVEARDNALDWLCNCDGFWHIDLGGMTFYLEEENNEITKANIGEAQRRLKGDNQ